MLGQVASALYWYNPLVWIALSTLRREQERACDDLVVSAGTSSTAYARHLCDVALAPRTRTCPQWVTLAMAEPSSQLEQRIVAILDDATNRRHLSRGEYLRLVGAVAVLAVIVGMVRLSPIDARPRTAGASGTLLEDMPDFSGTWLLDGARSESVTLDEWDPRRQAEVGEVLVITQTAEALQIKTWRRGEEQAITYLLDGSPTRRVLSTDAGPMGQMQRGEAVWSRWDKGTLLTVAKPFWIWTPAVTGEPNSPVRSSAETIYVRRLGDDGRSMTVERIGRSDFGWVFEGKEPSAAYAKVRDVYTRSAR